jgi:OPA family glycerol-3-phosphate transporter-like MFS transporter/OPA family sugar phosphate sensor protein UhpC-like MFS transporter
MRPALDYAAAPPREPLLTLRPPPAAPRLSDPADVDRLYARWQTQILASTIVGYALFYFVRSNLAVALPEMEKQAGISKASLGLFLSLHGVIYGVSKFVNGFAGDRLNARTFMALGLILCAAANFAFGLSTAAVVMGVLWMLNGWFQGMGFPPCARLMTHWFEPKKLATKMSVWNTSHSLGAAGAAVLCGAVAAYSWRLAFLVPAALAAAGSVFLLCTLRDRPEAMGLPPVEREQGDLIPIEEETRQETFWRFLLRHVLSNPYIWLLSLANFFVYTVRLSLGNWMTTFLSETRHLTLSHASWNFAAFEISGLAGMLLSGWITDRLFAGRGIRTCLFYMLGCGAALVAFWKVAGQSQLATTSLLCAAGFFIYGPQALVGICAANLATKRAAATAVGLTGIFGYASTVLSGWGLGLLVQSRGWDVAFAALVGVTAVGALLFAIAWPARAHGYDRADEPRRAG